MQRKLERAETELQELEQQHQQISKKAARAPKWLIAAGEPKQGPAPPPPPPPPLPLPLPPPLLPLLLRLLLLLQLLRLLRLRFQPAGPAARCGDTLTRPQAAASWGPSARPCTCSPT